MQLFRQVTRYILISFRCVSEHVNSSKSHGTHIFISDVPVTTAYPPTQSPPGPTITISVSEPTIQIVDVGSTVRYTCSGSSILEVCYCTLL